MDGEAGSREGCSIRGRDPSRQGSSVGPDLAVHALIPEELENPVRRLHDFHFVEWRTEKEDSWESDRIASDDRVVGVGDRHRTRTIYRPGGVEKRLPLRRHACGRFRRAIRPYPNTGQFRAGLRGSRRVVLASKSCHEKADCCKPEQV